jgi:hypothetical protein
MIMGEEPLGLGHDAGEGHAFGDVLDQASVADRGCECEGQHPVGMRTVAGARPSSVRPCTQLETSECVMRASGTSSQRGRVWRRRATS